MQRQAVRSVHTLHYGITNRYISARIVDSNTGRSLVIVSTKEDDLQRRLPPRTRVSLSEVESTSDKASSTPTTTPPPPTKTTPSEAALATQSGWTYAVEKPMASRRQLEDDAIRAATQTRVQRHDAERAQSRKNCHNKEAATLVGEAMAARAAEQGISAVLWRAPGAYHGRLRAFIDAIHDSGLLVLKTAPTDGRRRR
jgi:ribosomal protein L18